MTIPQTNIEDEITRLASRLEDATLELAKLSEERANAEMHYRRKVAILKAQHHDTKPAPLRDSRVEQGSLDDWHSWQLVEAQEVSQREMCRTIRAQLDALRTLAANQRGQV